MTSTSRNARLAGLLYLCGAVVGFFNIMYVPNTLIVRGDPVTTANNIATHDLLFRLGIVSDLLIAVTGIAITLALYRLFVAVDKNQAILITDGLSARSSRVYGSSRSESSCFGRASFPAFSASG